MTLAGAGTTVATYVYNASGQRIEKTTSSGTFYYLYDLAGHMISKLTSTGSWNRGEIFAGGRHLATYVSSTTYFDHGDWLGTERARTDVNGAVCETIESSPFGDGMGISGSCGDPSPLHFTGKQRDSETGLDYFGARYDSSSVGRFMTPDWSAKVEPVPYAKLGDPQSLDLYTYAGDSPVTTLDPNGHCVEDACVGEGTAVLITGAIVFTMETIRYYQQNPDASAAVAAGAHAAGRAVSGAVATIGRFFSKSKPGTLGKADHQQTAAEEAARTGGQREVKINTPEGQKGSRRADAAVVEKTTGRVTGEVVQVYRPTPAGNIPKRERDAASDIERATGRKPTMVPVRPLKPSKP